MECATGLWRQWTCFWRCHSAHVQAHITAGLGLSLLRHTRRTFKLSVHTTGLTLLNALRCVAPCVIVFYPTTGALRSNALSKRSSKYMCHLKRHLIRYSSAFFGANRETSSPWHNVWQHSSQHQLSSPLSCLMPTIPYDAHNQQYAPPF